MNDRGPVPPEHVPLQERIDALARALYTAGLARSDLDKDGLPRLIAEGVYANLRKVQRLDLVRLPNAEEWVEGLNASESPPTHCAGCGERFAIVPHNHAGQRFGDASESGQPPDPDPGGDDAWWENQR